MDFAVTADHRMKKKESKKIKKYLVWFGLVWFYGISTFVGYLMPNPFLYKKSVLFQTIQFNMSTQFNYQKYFYLSYSV